MFVVGQDTEVCVVKTQEYDYVPGVSDTSLRLRPVGQDTWVLCCQDLRM